MNLRNKISRNAGSTAWVGGFQLTIGNDGVVRNVPADLAKKLLTNPDVWAVEKGEVGLDIGLPVNSPSLGAQVAPAPIVASSMPLSSALLEEVSHNHSEAQIIASAMGVDIMELGSPGEIKAALMAGADSQFVASAKKLLATPLPSTGPEPEPAAGPGPAPKATAPAKKKAPTKKKAATKKKAPAAEEPSEPEAPTTPPETPAE